MGKIERGEVRDSDISLLLGAGSSLGGARPKAVIFTSAGSAKAAT